MAVKLSQDKFRQLGIIPISMPNNMVFRRSFALYFLLDIMKALINAFHILQPARKWPSTS